jgi:hypothetical protein
VDHEGRPGTGGVDKGGHYITFVEPRSGCSSPNSIEGYLNNLGAFSAGALRARGGRRLAARLIVLTLLLPIIITVLQSVWTLCTLLWS